jgi:N6-L-threonylcarbamoyladenine synthase
MLVLGIETSCDETSVALVDENRILSNVISSQVKVHEKYGGVVPELASRHHLDNISWVLNEAFVQAHISEEQVQGIGVTYGPGLVGSLLVGLNAAKALSYCWKIPFVGVNHLEAHLHSIFLEHPQAELPMLSVIASGGHTSLYFLHNKDRYELLGQTRDDAVGEAFDKVAKMLGLGYPGGPVIDRLANNHASNSIGLSRPHFGEETYDFSYSGIKTAVLYYIQKAKIAAVQNGSPSEEVIEICRCFQTIAIETLLEPMKRAAIDYRPRSISFSGGVACNSYLRQEAKKWSEAADLPVYFPSLILSTDNAAMIAAVAHHKLTQGLASSYSLNAEPNLKY